ncbi:MAG: glycosyltransferase [Dysgonamonadaceae bacterium]
MNLAPILLFVYNRLPHTERSVASLALNKLASDSTLIIYSDGAKGEQDVDSVTQVREYIRSIQGFAEVRIIERDKNWGLAANIVDGVTAQLSQYGRVIVLEDDLVLSPYFLKFMNDALETYQNEPRVGHIQGCDFTHDPSLPDSFLVKWTGSWGWATWDRAWKHLNLDGKALLAELESANLTKVFDFNGTYGYTKMLRKQIEGKNNSWAIRWNASLFLKDILSLNVGKSLVSNEGFDGSGTHCGGGGLYSNQLFMQEIPVVKISPIEESKLGRKAIENFYRRTNSFTAKAIRRIKRTLKGDFGD